MPSFVDGYVLFSEAGLVLTLGSPLVVPGT